MKSYNFYSIISIELNKYLFVQNVCLEITKHAVYLQINI